MSAANVAEYAHRPQIFFFDQNCPAPTRFSGPDDALKRHRDVTEYRNGRGVLPPSPRDVRFPAAVRVGQPDLARERRKNPDGPARRTAKPHFLRVKMSTSELARLRGIGRADWESTDDPAALRVRLLDQHLDFVCGLIAAWKLRLQKLRVSSTSAKNAWLSSGGGTSLGRSGPRHRRVVKNFDAGTAAGQIWLFNVIGQGSASYSSILAAIGEWSPFSSDSCAHHGCSRSSRGRRAAICGEWFCASTNPGVFETISCFARSLVPQDSRRNRFSITTRVLNRPRAAIKLRRRGRAASAARRTWGQALGD
jgi:hypothetical protein